MKATKDKWVWMPHPGHLIVSRDCGFHLNTYVGGYIISTVGEYWPDRQVREIHASVVDKKWLEQNRHLKGDYFDSAYMQRFGWEEIGLSRTYETMVFKAGKSNEACCPFDALVMRGEKDFVGYETAAAAYKGHLKLCKRWAAKPR
jgi:hypothetical protein